MMQMARADSVAMTAIMGISIALYAFGVVCGVWMLESDSRALKANRWFWALQIPAFQTSALGYSFASGAWLIIYLQPEPWYVGFTAMLGSQFSLTINRWTRPDWIGMNAFALALFVFLSLRTRSERLEPESDTN